MGRGQQRDAESGGDEPAQRADVVALERDPRRVAGARAQLVGDGAQAVLGLHRDERVVGDLGEPRASATGEAMGGWHDQPQRLARERMPADRRVVGARAGEDEVGAAVVQRAQHLGRAVLCELQRDAGMGGAEAAQQRRHQPAAERVQEGEHDGAAAGAGGRRQLLAPGVELRERAAGVLEVEAAVAVEPQAPAVAVEQRHADVGLHARERSGQRRLADVQLGGGGGHVLALGDRDEPAQLLEGHRTGAGAGGWSATGAGAFGGAISQMLSLHRFVVNHALDTSLDPSYCEVRAVS